MIRYLLLLSIAALPVFPQANPPSSNAAKLDRLLEVMHLESTLDQIMTQMSTVTQAMLPKDFPESERPRLEAMQAQMLAASRKVMSWQRLKPMYIKIYEEVLTTEEIDGLLTFYSSPIGQSSLQKMPILMQKSMQIMPALMQELQPELQRIVKENLPKAP